MLTNNFFKVVCDSIYPHLLDSGDAFSIMLLWLEMELVTNRVKIQKPVLRDKKKTIYFFL